MTSIEDDIALGRSVEKQFQLIAEAYERGDENSFDQAVNQVADIRRLNRAGILDLWEEHIAHDPDAGGTP